ncbi:hypothetical protein B296_00052058 [Ensete ventricosum]|uniref:Uncharacterized protein n=1 Tax=Ensete ventricosum TaxID=4639 RepID=A0A426Y9V5_ENSVE|nr:hypothetical protein B296_00052058 [Ensete ventricosum]
MESNSADVIKMPKKGKHAPVGLIIPHLNLVVISCKYNFAVSMKCTNKLDPPKNRDTKLHRTTSGSVRIERTLRIKGAHHYNDRERDGSHLLEGDAAYGSFVLLKAIDKRALRIVPPLDDAAVEASKNPRPVAVEASAAPSPGCSSSQTWSASHPCPPEGSKAMQNNPDQREGANPPITLAALLQQFLSLVWAI